MSTENPTGAEIIARPPYTAEELEKIPYTERDVTPAQPRSVFVLWDNDTYGSSEILAVYASEKAADAASSLRYQDIKRVPFYEH